MGYRSEESLTEPKRVWLKTLELGQRVQNEAELDSALNAALRHEGPALVEVMTDVMLV